MAADEEDRRSVRVSIEGAVQGVGYRCWAERVATGLGLTGWVRNRLDGSVEALFCGEADDVAEMLDRCREGPPASRVTAVTILEEGEATLVNFEVLQTA